MDVPAPMHVVILARRPEPGRAKTRLIPLLGERGAARLHAELLAETLAVVRRWARKARGSFEVRLCGGAPDDGLRRLLTGTPCREQGPGDLGDRIERAVREALQEGARRVVLVGTDCPDLRSRHLDLAQRALATQELVLGAARDGGFYLLGARRPVADVLAGMPWGAADLLRRTIAAAGQQGLETCVLEELPDLDTPEDLIAWTRSRLVAEGASPRLSVVVPTLDEEGEIAAALISALQCPGVEVVVCDGGSTDRTVSIARSLGARVASTAPSRGRQLAAGARVARGETLLFLHADSRLPAGYEAQVRSVLARPGTAAGAFHLAIEGEGWGLRMVEGGVRVRSLVWRRPYGDQALFLRARILRAAGGFPDLRRMEDYVLLERLRSRGRVRMARGVVRTSDRRWRRQGVLRTTLRNQWVLLTYHLGCAAGE